MSVEEGQRLDKWLKIARLYKSRAQATEACESRRIKVNGETAKPAKHIKPGDTLTVRRPNGQYLDIKVLGLSEKNLAKDLAKKLLHIDLPEVSEEDRSFRALFDQAVRAAQPRQKGRPTKKQRRDLDKFKQAQK